MNSTFNFSNYGIVVIATGVLLVEYVLISYIFVFNVRRRIFNKTFLRDHFYNEHDMYVKEDIGYT